MFFLFERKRNKRKERREQWGKKKKEKQKKKNLPGDGIDPSSRPCGGRILPMK
jgi:hypothetical protein